MSMGVGSTVAHRKAVAFRVLRRLVKVRGGIHTRIARRTMILQGAVMASRFFKQVK